MFLSLSSMGAAEDRIQLIHLDGPVQVWRVGTGQWQTFTNRSVVYVGAGDHVMTLANTRAALRFPDGSLCLLRADARLEITARQEEERWYILKLIRSSLRFFRRGSGVTVEVETPRGHAVVKGTEFVYDVVDEDDAILTLIEGRVTVDGEEVAAEGEAQIVLISAGEPLVRSTARLLGADVMNSIQWCLYYPGVLDLAELQLTDLERTALEGSLMAYRKGDLVGAVLRYPEGRDPVSEEERVYFAAIQLAIGRVEVAESVLATVSVDGPLGNRSRTERLARAVELMMDAVRRHSVTELPGPITATEWLARSYYAQSVGELRTARGAAEQAVKLSPEFGFAVSRLAELRFSFGERESALEMVGQGLSLSPRNAQGWALNGFLLAAGNRLDEAVAAFERAIILDAGLGNAWFGRGLCRIRAGETQRGLNDLSMAVLLEPQRSLLRSYLGKGFALNDARRLAEGEFDLARNLDPEDPTPWLYSALMQREYNRVNRAVRELEESKRLNDNRAIHRSRMLLDEDLAVRSSNLAVIYQDAGMEEVALKEAGAALSANYASYAAHLFLANAYDALSDPRGINLRYETARLSEYLVANLLAPVGAGTLSPYVSQHEYSRMFDRRRLGMSSVTEYRSQGDWFQVGSQYGILENQSYSLNAVYHHSTGPRLNSGFERLTLSATYKQQVNVRDSLFIEAGYFDGEAGDVIQRVNGSGREGLQLSENQEPVLYVGYHRRWNPGMHTLFLAEVIRDDLSVVHPEASFLAVLTDTNDQPVLIGEPGGLHWEYESELQLYGGELQHIQKYGNQTTVLGARYQRASFDVKSENPVMFGNRFFLTPETRFQEEMMHMDRVGVYGYHDWRIADRLTLSGGLAYDWLRWPENLVSSPIGSEQVSTHRLSPSAGVVWVPTETFTVRGGYSRDLGGVSSERSVQLEPTTIGGFNKAFRSLIPEDVVGGTTAPRFETFHIALEQEAPGRVYVGVVGELLRSKVNGTRGALQAPLAILGGMGTQTGAIQLQETLEFEEATFLAYANWLISEGLSVGASFRRSRARLKERIPSLAGFAAAEDEQRSELNQFRISGVYRHRSGLYGSVEGLWYDQEDVLGGGRRDFWHWNLMAGARLCRQRVEVAVGVLNIGDVVNGLDPLNAHHELPRERTFVARMRLSF